MQVRDIVPGGAAHNEVMQFPGRKVLDSQHIAHMHYRTAMTNVERRPLSMRGKVQPMRVKSGNVSDSTSFRIDQATQGSLQTHDVLVAVDDCQVHYLLSWLSYFAAYYILRAGAGG